jgi:outer membrane lipoprotein carrier protein
MRKILLALILLTPLVAQESIQLPDSFRANFDQTITSDKGKKIYYRGDILFSSPNSFKWSYNAPTPKEVCTDGRELLVVDHDLEQVSTYRIDSSLNLSKILKRAKLSKNSTYMTTDRGKKYYIKLDTKQRLHSVAYRDDLDNIVSIIFSKMRYNKDKIKSSKLKCNYPSSYDQIRE